MKENSTHQQYLFHLYSSKTSKDMEEVDKTARNEKQGVFGMQPVR